MSAASCSRPPLSGPGSNHPVTCEGLAPTFANAAGWRSISQGFETGPCGLGDAPNIRKLSGFLDPSSACFTQHQSGAAGVDSWSCSVPSHRSY